MAITCRPAITFAIGKTSRWMHQPTPTHVASLEYLLSYLLRTRDYKLHYCRSGCNVRGHFTNSAEQDSSIAYYAGPDRHTLTQQLALLMLTLLTSAMN